MYPKEFSNYMSYCGFNRISIAELYNNYKHKNHFVTKQIITKWLTMYSHDNGYKLLTKSNGRYRYYDFEQIGLNVTENDIINLPIYERINIPHKLEKEARELIKSFKGINIGYDKNNAPFIIRVK